MESLPKQSKPVIYFIDIETTPLISYTWGTYEQDVIEVIEHSHLLTFAVKQLGKPVVVKGLLDYPSYKKDPKNDKELMLDLWHYLDEADIVVWQNGDRFDMKKINTRFSFYNIKPPSPYKTVDTLKVARSNFAHDSNRLDNMGKFYSLGEKVHTGGFELWKACMAGDKTAWGKMKKYNAQDVVLLEKIYKHFLPWMKTHPNYSVFIDKKVCPKCGSSRLRSLGLRRNFDGLYRRLICLDCGGPAKGVVKNEQKVKSA